MSDWMTVALVVAVNFGLILLLRTFPGFLGNAVLKAVEHRNNVKLEQIKSELAISSQRSVEGIKAELQATSASLKSSVDFLGAGQSELRSKVISAVEAMWRAMVVIREEFGSVIFVETILTESEIEEAVRKKDFRSVLFEYPDFGRDGYIDEKLSKIDVDAVERARIFVGDRLWLLFYVFRAFHGRLGILAQQSVKESRYVGWRGDKHFDQILETVLSKQQIEAAKKNTVYGAQSIVGLIEAMFLKECARVMSGSTGFAESISDVQATMLLEAQRVSAALRKEPSTG